MTEELDQVDQERIDKYIWRHAGRKPVSAIAIELGIRPDEVLRRKNELLEEIDALTIQQKQAKILIELDEMSADARDRAKRTDDEFYAGMLNTAVGAMKTMLVELNRMKDVNSEAVDRLNLLRQREILRLIDKVVANSVAQISVQHDLDEEELMEVFEGNLVEAARELEEAE